MTTSQTTQLRIKSRKKVDALNYSAIKYNDVADGPGIRISLFVSGCTNHCEGCFNKDTWSFDHGEPFTDKIINEILDNLQLVRYTGITILGGEPFELQNQPAVLDFMKKVKARFPEKTIWMYSGFTYDKDLAPGGKRYIDGTTDQILSLADVLVDGKFVLALKNICLKFRGSENQRVIDLKKSTYDNVVLLFE
jgi:anaerobic ribonucleoside-triphosphate reductase activating protein